MLHNQVNQLHKYRMTTKRTDLLISITLRAYCDCTMHNVSDIRGSNR